MILQDKKGFNSMIEYSIKEKEQDILDILEVYPFDGKLVAVHLSVNYERTNKFTYAIDSYYVEAVEIFRPETNTYEYSKIQEEDCILIESKINLTKLVSLCEADYIRKENEAILAMAELKKDETINF